MIKTERLELVPLGPAYLESYNRYASDRELCCLMMYLPMDGIGMSEKFLRACEIEWTKEKPQAWEFAILLEGKNIGEISIYDEEGKAELGWILSSEFQGKGYAFEAAEAIMNYSKNVLGFSDFIAHCDSENVPSYRLMEKLGMKRTGERFGRKNKLSDELRTEYTYEISLQKQS